MKPRKRRAATALLYVFAACGGVETKATTAEFTRVQPGSCEGAAGANASATMDTYVIEVARVKPGVEVSATRSYCETCMGDPEACAFVEKRCLCGGVASTLPPDGQLRAALSGTSIRGLEDGAPHCLRVIALRRGALREGPVRPCACEAEWLQRQGLVDEVRLCAVTRPLVPGLLPFTADVRCPADGAAFQTCAGR